MGQILCVGIAMLLGLLSTRLMKLIHLPNVTGYLLAGILVGPCVLGPYIGGWTLDGTTQVAALSWISDIALGFIAFSIGTSFDRKALGQIGKKAIIIAVCEGLGGTIITMCALFIAYAFNSQISIPVILTLGAIASATAPAATLMVVRQYRAKGPVVQTLLPVVAFDDVVALVLFSILFAVSKSLANQTSINLINMVLSPILEIVCSIALGFVFGFLMSFGCKFIHSKANRLIMCVVAIVLTVGISQLPFSQWFGFNFEISSLLTCLSISVTLSNMRKDSSEIIANVDSFTPPLFMLFFVLSGASLNFYAFGQEGLGVVIAVAGVIYIFARCAGKFLGAFVSAKATKSDPKVGKYLGYMLFPQAGVAIGLSTIASQELPYPDGTIILTVVLAATIIYELFGPIITKTALAKAGEIELPPKKRKQKTV